MKHDSSEEYTQADAAYFDDSTSAMVTEPTENTDELTRRAENVDEPEAHEEESTPPTENVRESAQQAKNAGELTQPTENADEADTQRYPWADLDGNGEEEYIVVQNCENENGPYGVLKLYYNQEMIYEYMDELEISYVGEKDYLDLDGDLKPEIFVSFQPMVNSMPLMEYFVLKEYEDGWKPLHIFDEHGEDDGWNAFPISVMRGEKESEGEIICEGLDKKILLNMERHYQKEEFDPYRDAYYLALENGDRIGGTCAWGVWSICSGVYEGQNCLIATHGIEGVGGKLDFFGTLDIYFCFDGAGDVKILDMVFYGDEAK